jgi:peptide/nickel transport system substrate-binding protein
MHMRLRNALRFPALFAVLALALTAVSGCGSSSDGTSSSSGDSGSDGGSVTAVTSSAWDSVDPQVGITGQARQAMWVVNTPLLTFRHASGLEGDEVVPGLATGMPKITNGGKTYTLTLRKGLKYSDGTPVKASDFAYAIERALGLNWAQASSFTENIVGADKFLAEEADAISGIETDDASGKIEIQLTGPFGGFDALLALPAAAPIPADTPMKPQNTDPPAGYGPYMFESVTPNAGYTLVKNPEFKPLPNVPAGHVDTITMKVNTNVQAAAEQVLENQVDVFSPDNPLPPLLVQRTEREAADRFQPEPTPATLFFFFGVEEKPFDNPIARQAVLTAIDFDAFAKFSSGLLEPDCYLTPTTVPGHPSAPCPYHAADAPGDIAKAKQMVQESGTAGESITVFSETTSPQNEYANYMVDLLNQIGYDARPKLLTPSVYYGTVGNPETKAQMGYVNWAVGSPSPSDMWLAFLASSGPALNMGHVDDPRINSTVPRLNAQPLDAVTDQWAELDEYGVEEALYAAFGHPEYVKFMSDRIDFDSAVFSPMFQVDYASLQLK